MKTKDNLTASELSYTYVLAYLRVLKTHSVDIETIKSRLINAKDGSDFHDVRKIYLDKHDAVNSAFGGIDEIVAKLGDATADKYVQKTLDLINGHMEGNKLVNGHYTKYKIFFAKKFKEVDNIIATSPYNAKKTRKL